MLALADGHLSTPKVFRELDRQRQGQQVKEPELSKELMQALNAGDPMKLGAALTNDLQEPALTLFPALRKTLAAGIEAGALGALVSGSGPTCFFLAETADQATTLANKLSERESKPRRNVGHRPGTRRDRHIDDHPGLFHPGYRVQAGRRGCHPRAFGTGQSVLIGRSRRARGDTPSPAQRAAQPWYEMA